MMYTFKINDGGPDPDIILTRAMLVLAAIAAMVYRNDENYFPGLLSSMLLILAAIFIRLITGKWRINKFVLLLGAAIVLYMATSSVAFPLLLLVYGYLAKFLYKKPIIEITHKGIIIKKLFGSPAYKWNEFSNIILKDGLLTLDFKNNKLVQVNIDENKTGVDENAFNDFCKGFI